MRFSATLGGTSYVAIAAFFPTQCINRIADKQFIASASPTQHVSTPISLAVQARQVPYLDMMLKYYTLANTIISSK